MVCNCKFFADLNLCIKLYGVLQVWLGIMETVAEIFA